MIKPFLCAKLGAFTHRTSERIGDFLDFLSLVSDEMLWQRLASLEMADKFGVIRRTEFFTPRTLEFKRRSFTLVHHVISPFSFISEACIAVYYATDKKARTR